MKHGNGMQAFLWLRKVHGFVGLFSLPLIVFFTATGFLLTHEEQFGLSDRATTNAFLLWMFGHGKSLEGKGSLEVSALDTLDAEKLDEAWMLETEVDYPESELPSLGRVVTAFHGGQFWGKSVPILLDLLSAGLMILVISGPLMWILGKKRMSVARAPRKELRCVRCSRLLMKGQVVWVEIKCPRCGFLQYLGEPPLQKSKA